MVSRKSSEQKPPTSSQELTVPGHLHWVLLFTRAYTWILNRESKMVAAQWNRIAATDRVKIIAQKSWPWKQNKMKVCNKKTVFRKSKPSGKRAPNVIAYFQGWDKVNSWSWTHAVNILVCRWSLDCFSCVFRYPIWQAIKTGAVSQARSHALATTWALTNAHHHIHGTNTRSHVRSFSSVITVEGGRCVKIFLHPKILNNAPGVESLLYSPLGLERRRGPDHAAEPLTQ